MAELALTCVGSHVPEQNAQKGWITQRRMLRHAARCSDIVTKELFSITDLEWALNQIGSLYTDQGKIEEAEKMYQRALVGYEKALRPEHTSTLDIANNLGNLYTNLGRLEEAEKMYQRALVGKEKALGPEHTSTLETVNNLGNLYANLGRLEEAEKMYQRALVGKEQAWGPEHISTLDTVNNIGTIIYRRCYVAARTSSHNVVLVYVKHLANLCMKFPHSRLPLFGHIGRAFAWLGDDETAAAAFSHQLALSSPEYHAYCDGCHLTLNLGTGRLVCKVCEAGDLCRSCFTKMESKEPREVLSSCRTHKFLDLDSAVSSVLTDDTNISISSDQWLKDIAKM